MRSRKMGWVVPRPFLPERERVKNTGEITKGCVMLKTWRRMVGKGNWKAEVKL